jgi:hypothetical protein
MITVMSVDRFLPAGSFAKQSFPKKTLKPMSTPIADSVHFGTTPASGKAPSNSNSSSSGSSASGSGSSTADKPFPRHPTYVPKKVKEEEKKRKKTNNKGNASTGKAVSITSQTSTKK